MFERSIIHLLQMRIVRNYKPYSHYNVKNTQSEFLACFGAFDQLAQSVVIKHPMISALKVQSVPRYLVNPQQAEFVNLLKNVFWDVSKLCLLILRCKTAHANTSSKHTAIAVVPAELHQLVVSGLSWCIFLVWLVWMTSSQPFGIRGPIRDRKRSRDTSPIRPEALIRFARYLCKAPPAETSAI